MLQKELNSKQRNEKMTKSIKLNKKAKKGIKKLEEKGKSEGEKIKELTEIKTKEKKIPEAKSKDAPEKKEKPEKEQKKADKKPIVKKTEAVVNGRNLPISTKHAVAICKFIRNKKIENAISDLEQVVALKKSIPMEGEIPHRKGKGLSSGRFPRKAAERIMKLLRSASANATNDGIENPIIKEAIANIGSRPWGRFGQVRKKRTHIKIVVRSKKEEEK